MRFGDAFGKTSAVRFSIPGHGPITTKRFGASTPILVMSAVCIPVSMRRIGSRDGSPVCALVTLERPTSEPSRKAARKILLTQLLMT
jgi:hypothetical protein